MKNILKITIIPALILTVSGCQKTQKYKSFEDDILTPSNGVYADLGNHLILIDEAKTGNYQDAVNYSKTIHAPSGGACTTCAVKNNKGEVIIGRNLDMVISPFPAYIIKTLFGRYKTLQFRYLDSDLYTYDEFKTEGWKNPNFINYLNFAVSDAMNEKGLYIEANVREANLGYQCNGTNPGKLDLYYNFVVSMVAQNCATVDEAIDYLTNQVNYISNDYVDYSTPTDYGYMIGDATGKYGVIEIAQNKIHFTPYQCAQANYYIHPELSANDEYGSGQGRYERAIDGLNNVQTMEDAYNQIGKAMWNTHTLYSDLSYIDENGKPHFVDDKGNPVADWRSDYGQEALKYYWPAEEIDRVLGDKTTRWMIDDANVETVFYYCKDFFKNIGAKQALIDYYAGDDDAIREDVFTYTTGIRFGINCKQKRMMMTFFERDNLTYEFSF